MLPFAAIALVAIAQAPDQLEELVRRSAEIPHFRATFQLTSTVSASASEITIDYGGPTRVRVDSGAGDARTSMWSVDGVLAIVAGGGAKPLHGRVDCREVYGLFDAVEEQLRREFPDARPRGELRSAVSMRWLFDEQAGKSNYAIETTITTGSPSPMGWLDTLVQKSATPIEEGELLRFSTDGHFDLSVSRATGMLQEFRGRSPKGEMRLVLKSVDFATPPPAERFELPATPATGATASDVSLELRRSIARAAEMQLRRRMYDVLGAAKGPLDGPQGAHGLATLKVRSLCRRFHELTLESLAAPLRERSAKVSSGVVERLRKLKSEGRTREELEALCAKETASLEEQLATFSTSLQARTQPPSGTEELPNARELASIEATVLQELLKDRVVDPVLADFRRACDEGLR